MTSPDAAPQRETIDLRPFVGAVLADFEITAQARHVTLDGLVFLDEINGDASLLRPLLAGLVAEALRRAPAGTNVSVVVSPRNGQAEIRIADEGSGMTTKAREQAFSANAAYGGRLSVKETDNGTVVCLAVPSEVGNTEAGRRAVEGKAMSGVTRVKPALPRFGSGIYARAGALAPTAPSGGASRPARASGKET